MASKRDDAAMAVPALCHLCSRPTLRSCRNCGRPACDEHIAGGVCVECRVGRRGRAPGVRVA